MKPYVAILLFLLGLLAINGVIYARNIRSTQTFNSFFGSGSALSLQLIEDSNLTMTVSSGTLNSTSCTLYSSYNEGWYSFNSSQAGVLTVNFNGLNRVTPKINGTTLAPLDDGDTVTFASYAGVVILWDLGIVDPTQWLTMPFILLTGIIMTCLGSFYGANKIRNFEEETLLHIGFALVIVIIGVGLIITVLW